jgi:hypothetical protein
MERARETVLGRVRFAPMPEQRADTLVIAGAADRVRSEVSLLDALRADGRFDVCEVGTVNEGSDEIAALGRDYEAIVVFLTFRDLDAATPLDWHGFDGLRVMYDHDAFYNYATLGSLQGAWTSTFARHCFDLLVCTGLRTAEMLTADGIRAAWVPKGYDPRRFKDVGHTREGVCTFGSRYPARAAMVSHLRRHEVAFDEFRVPYEDLNERLNQYAGCLICNFDGRYRFGRIGGRLARVHDGAPARFLLRPRPGFETMLKNYESAASGCAVFCDSLPELSQLGFVDGDTVIVYETFDELVDQVRAYEQDLDALRAIGRRGAALCLSRHTWTHRAGELADVVKQHRT